MSYDNFKRPLNSFMIYRIVIHNYLKANNVRCSNCIISKLASQLWRNESEEIKNEYKQLAETMKCYEQKFETEAINDAENPISLGTTNDYPSINNNTEPNMYVQLPTHTLNINSSSITNDTENTTQTLNFQNNQFFFSFIP
ncbi:10901_t:CDS:1 [Dentiscutata erythropus]|uniref:10901_t:CDS:1 n=1 Tax=Dentiscutata erythropus TaxID=1348616 RepID=A0A9N8W6H5_9GLOM|nr:10901_t:CDS:1 [Dentiscutata erythropus]